MSENVGFEEEETGIPEEHIDMQNNSGVPRGMGNMSNRVNYQLNSRS